MMPRMDQLDADALVAEFSSCVGVIATRAAEHAGYRKWLFDENAKLRARVAELEKELAALKPQEAKE